MNKINRERAIACSLARPNIENKNTNVASLVPIPDTVMGSRLAMLAIETRIITCQKESEMFSAIENR